MTNKLRQYDEYRKTDLLWIDRIPRHWKLKKIKHLFKERTERGYPDEPLLAATQAKGVVPKSMYEHRTVTAEKDLHLLKLVEVGDFVISLRSFQGGIEYAYYRGIISPAYTIMVPNEAVNRRYFGYLAKSQPFLELLGFCVTGIREGQNIDYGILKNSYIPVPPLEEQEQIARYLDDKISKINRLIRAKKKQIDLLKEQKQVVINHVVTNGLDPNSDKMPSNIEGLGDVPRTWSVKPLKYFVRSNIETLTNSFDGDKIINYIDISTVGFGELKQKPVRYFFKDAPSRARRVIRTGDTIISTVRTYLKSMCYVGEDLDGFVASTGFAVLTPSKREVHPRLLSYVLSADYFLSNVSKNSTGVSYPAISDSKLLALKIALPSDLNEQREMEAQIQEKTHKLDIAISRLTEELELLIEYRTSLVSQVVTGKIDVRGIETEDPVQFEEDLDELYEGELESLEIEEGWEEE